MAQVGAAALLLAGCGGASTAAPASSAAAPSAAASASAKPSAAAAGSAATKPASSGAASSAAKPSGAGSAAASGLIPIKTAYTTTSGTSIPLWVAKEGGYFAQNGLDATVAFVASGAPILAAVESGDLPLSNAGGQEIVNAIVNGSQVVMVGGFGHKPTNSIITNPKITKPEDLRGKTIGVSGIGAVSHVAGLLAVQKLGLGDSVKFLATGGLPETLAGIKTGKVDGGMLSPPQTFEAVEKEGLREVVDVSKLDIKYQAALVVTTRKYLADHQDIVERYMRAMIQGTHRAYTDKAFTVAAIVKYAKISDQGLAEKTYDYFHDGDVWDKDGVILPEAVQTNIDVAAQTIPAAKNFKPAQMIDTKAIDKITASGLVKQLYGG